jgi:hypothetical protein
MTDVQIILMSPADPAKSVITSAADELAIRETVSAASTPRVHPDHVYLIQDGRVVMLCSVDGEPPKVFAYVEPLVRRGDLIG